MPLPTTKSRLYVNPDRDFTRQLIQRAEAAKYEALVATCYASSWYARVQRWLADRK